MMSRQPHVVVALLAGLLCSAGGWAQPTLLGPGAYVDDAIVVDLTNPAIGSLGPVVPWLAGDTLGVPPTSTSVDCPFDCSTTVQVDLSNTIFGLELVRTDLQVTDGQLHLIQYLDVQLNDATNPAIVDLGNGSPRSCSPGDPCCAADGCPSDVCTVYSDPVPIRVEMVAEVDVADPDGPGGDPPVFDVNLYTAEHNAAQALSDTSLNSTCTGGTDLGLWLGAYLDTALTDLLQPRLTNFLENNAPNVLAATLPAAIGMLTMADSTDLQGAILDYGFYMADLELLPTGARLRADMAFDTPATHPCVAAFDPGGSVTSPNPLPEFVSHIPGDGRRYDVGAVVSDDAMNQILYAFWRTGLLCQTVDDSLGFPLDTSLLGLGLGDQVSRALDELFVEGPDKLVLRTVPTAVPVADFTTEADVRVWLNDMDMEFYGQYLGRLTHLFTVRANLGLDLYLSFTEYGELKVTVDVHTENLDPRFVASDLLPELSSAVERSFGGFIELGLSFAGGMLLGDVFVGPLAFNGLGLVDSTVQPVGGAGDYMELFGFLGEPSQGQSQGGLACFDCDISSCIDPAACSCSADGLRDAASGSFPASVLLLLFPLLVMAVARRP
jgi:hypothetical protein